MDTFSWLLMGHLVGDWLLQNHWMARGKLAGINSWPLAVHCSVYTIVVMAAVALSAPLSSLQVIAVGAALFASHWVVDGYQLARWWGRIAQQSDTELVRVGVDQTLHLLALAGIAVWLSR